MAKQQRTTKPAVTDQVSTRTVVEALLERANYRGILAVLPLLDLDNQQRAQAAGLCSFAVRILELDAEDWNDLGGVPDELIKQAELAHIPQNPKSKSRGALQTLVPAYGVLQDVLQVRHKQRDMAAVLMVCHVMTEYLPLLAWEKQLGHAGDPMQLKPQVTRPGSLWGLDIREEDGKECAHAPNLRGSARKSVQMAEQDPSWDDATYTRLWRNYLDRDHSRVATALGTCAAKSADRPKTMRTCDRPCSVWLDAPGSDEAKADLADRMALAGLFAESEVLQLRHAAPVGHGFGVPDPRELGEAWQQTWKDLTAAWKGERRNPLHRVKMTHAERDNEPLPGLGLLIDTIAGQPVPRPGMLTTVEEALRALTD